jgi:hypothetical protein
MSTRGSKLARKQQAAVAALLAEPTHAAAAAGISLATLQRWLLTPAFQAAYRAARRQVVEHVVARLQQAGGQAVETLRANLAAERPGDQIRAACAVIDYALRGLEITDLVERVAELERVVAERQEQDRDGWHANGEGEPLVNGVGSGDADANRPAATPPPGDAPTRPAPPVRPGSDNPGPVAGRYLRLDDDADLKPLW